MKREQQRKLTSQERNSNPNSHLLCNARNGLLLAYLAIQGRLREREITEMDSGDKGMRENDIPERAIWETVTSSPAAK